MPRKTVVAAHRRVPFGSDKTNRLKVLFVEECSDEMNRFAEGVKGGFSCERVENGRSASRYLLGHSETDIVFVTMAFPSTSENDLLGAEDVVFERFKGDRGKAMEFLRQNQGAFIVHHLRKHVRRKTPILISHDFSAELQRWDTLSSRYENVYYCRSDLGAVDIADLMQTIVDKFKPSGV